MSSIFTLADLPLLNNVCQEEFFYFFSIVGLLFINMCLFVFSSNLQKRNATALV